MPDNFPESGDVVIHSTVAHGMPSYAICAFPGQDQCCCANRGDAERMGRSYARRFGVNLWFSEGPSGFALLARFRGAADGQRGPTPSADGAIGAAPHERPTTEA